MKIRSKKIFLAVEALGRDNGLGGGFEHAKRLALKNLHKDIDLEICRLAAGEYVEGYQRAIADVKEAIMFEMQKEIGKLQQELTLHRGGLLRAAEYENDE